MACEIFKVFVEYDGRCERFVGLSPKFTAETKNIILKRFNLNTKGNIDYQLLVFDKDVERYVGFGEDDEIQHMAQLKLSAVVSVDIWSSVRAVIGNRHQYQTGATISDSGYVTTSDLSEASALYTTGRPPADMVSKLKRLSRRLRKYMDPEFELPSRLLASSVISHEDVCLIRAQSTYYFMNDVLIKILMMPESEHDQSKYNRFLTGLVEDCQQHIKNFLDCDGDVGTKHGDDRPLEEKHLNFIDFNLPVLQNFLQITEVFLAQLLAVNIITSLHYDAIRQKATRVLKVGQLFDIMRRRSVKHYKGFTDAIRTVLRVPYLAEMLKLPAGTVHEIHIENSSSVLVPGTPEFIQCEEKYARAINDTISDGKGSDRSRRALKQLKDDKILSLGAKRRKSISLFVAVRSLEDFKRFESALNSGRLESLISELFEALFCSKKLKPSRIYVDEQSMIAARDYMFASESDNETQRDIRSTISNQEMDVSSDLCVIYNSDAKKFETLLPGTFSKETVIHMLLDSELRLVIDKPATKMMLHKAKAVLVIASMGHLAFIRKYPDFHYHALAKNVDASILFYYGTKENDMRSNDEKGNPIADRFPEVNSWFFIKPEKTDMLPKLIQNIMHRQRMEPRSSLNQSSSSTAREYSEVLSSLYSDKIYETGEYDFISDDQVLENVSSADGFQPATDVPYQESKGTERFPDALLRTNPVAKDHPSSQKTIGCNKDSACCEDMKSAKSSRAKYSHVTAIMNKLKLQKSSNRGPATVVRPGAALSSSNNLYATLRYKIDAYDAGVNSKISGNGSEIQDSDYVNAFEVVKLPAKLPAKEGSMEEESQNKATHMASSI